MWNRVRSWLCAIFRRSSMEREMAAELRFHIEAFAEDLVRGGMTPREAMRRARLEFGGIEQTKEECRDASGANLFDSLLQDIRYGLRQLRRNPGFTVVAAVSLSLSIGATAVVFTAIKSVLIDPLPYARVGELVQIRTEFVNADLSHGDWALWNDAREIIRRTRTLESVGIYGNAMFDLAGDASTPPEALYGLRVTATLFPALGVSPLLGRNILPEEDQPGHSNEMILSYGLWTRRFNADRSIVGRSVNINGHDCLVIGVMPAGFNFPLRREAAHTPSPHVEFWAPFRATDPHPTTGAVGVVARLRKGVSLFDAQQDLASISTALSQEFPTTNRDHVLRVGSLRDRTLGSAGKSLWFLMAAALLFLLIGCANVANLLLARSLVRQRELAIRVAIGANCARIVRQLLTESCVLAALGGLGGYVLTFAAWRVLPAVAPISIPRLTAARADWPILTFALGLSLLNGFLFGLIPALRSSSTQVVATYDFGARGASPGPNDRVRGALVAVEVAITVVLVIIGGQFLGSFAKALGNDPGFEADHVLASVILPAHERYQTPEQRSAVYRKFLEAVRALPGVESAGTVDALPFSGENHGGFISSSEAAVLDPSLQIVAEVDVVSSDYLQTMGVRLHEGRWFRENEMDNSSDVAIVNDVAARRLWPGASAVGKQLCVYCTPENPRGWKRVIAVVSDVRHATMDGPEQASVYLASSAMEDAAFLVARTDRPPADLVHAIRTAIAKVDPSQPVFLSASMRSLIADSLADRRFILTLLTITGCLALAMAVAGVYGVTSYTTSRRTQEIGIRMALGATSGNIQALVFRQAFFSTATGLAIGIFVTLALMRTLHGMLPGLNSAQPSDIWVSLTLVVLTAALACWIPAQRAAKMAPMSALRQD
jgi:putative ABC transport system permease protein